jgi:hypothetical protein
MRALADMATTPISSQTMFGPNLTQRYYRIPGVNVRVCNGKQTTKLRHLHAVLHVAPEIERSHELNESYLLCRLSDFSKISMMCDLPPPLKKHCKLQATQYKATVGA